MSSKVKYLDKTNEEWDSLVEYWHTEYLGNLGLQEYLGMDDTEYTKFLYGKH